MSASGLVPEERQADERPVCWCALGSPLVESCRQLYSAFHFRGDVQNYVDGHIEINAPEVLVDAQQVVVVTANLIDATGKIVDFCIAEGLKCWLGVWCHRLERPKGSLSL